MTVCQGPSCFLKVLKPQVERAASAPGFPEPLVTRGWDSRWSSFSSAPGSELGLDSEKDTQMAHSDNTG